METASRAALLERFPHLEAVLNAEPAATPVRDGEAVVDLDLGGTRLYGTDGRALASGQVEAYFEKPLRFFVTSARGANIGSPVSGRMLSAMFATCERLGVVVDDLEVKPQYEGSYLVVFGIGLGYHLEPLIEQTRARHIILIEPYPDFLRHALGTVDWAALLSRAEERGCKFTVSLAHKPDKIVEDIQKMFMAEGIPFIDGTYVFMHYPAWEMMEARDRLAQAVETMFVSRGFYEDELVMVTNTMGNLARSDFRLITVKLRPVRSEPVFVIGSGPSIDQTIDTVKKLRDKAVVFSCGTGMKICRAHGIIPDFHCEIENGDWVYDSLIMLRDRYGPFTGTALVASLSVDPRVPGLFDERFLFFRDTVSGTRILAPPGTEIFGAVPTVANTAMRAAMGMGFQTFYLFGIDCGAKSEEKKHSTLAVYNDSAQFKQFEDMMNLAYTTQGNFGGTVKSDWIFNFSRMMLEYLITNFRITVYNCSDGARIAGAVPKVAVGVTLNGPPLDRVLLKARLLEVLPTYQPAELLVAASFPTFYGELKRFHTDLLAMIDAAIAEDADFVAFWQRVSPFVEEAIADYARTPTVIKASLLSMPKIGMFFAHRIREPENRRTLFHAFLLEYREIAIFMCDGFLERLADLEAEYGSALTAADTHPEKNNATKGPYFADPHQDHDDPGLA